MVDDFDPAGDWWYWDDEGECAMRDFGWHSGESITKEIAKKVVDKCEVVDELQDNILQFTFTDGSILRIRYDWIYDWEIRPTQSGDEE